MSIASLSSLKSRSIRTPRFVTMGQENPAQAGLWGFGAWGLCGIGALELWGMGALGHGGFGALEHGGIGALEHWGIGATTGSTDYHLGLFFIEF